MQIEDNRELGEGTIEEIKNIESKELLWRYNNKSTKERIEKTSCNDFGNDDILNFNENKEIKSLEWKSVLRVNMLFLGVLVLICIYDLMTLESQTDIPIIFLSIFSGVIAVLFFLFQKVKLKNHLVFTITKDGILKDDRLFDWYKTQFFFYHKKGQSYLMVKVIQEEEIIISLYFLKYFPSRIICWIERYKNEHESISKTEHSN